MAETVGSKIAWDAWEAFDRWCRKHDPDGDMDPVEQAEAYAKWCDHQKRLADLPSELVGSPKQREGA
jgi:hypothetical protein